MHRLFTTKRLFNKTKKKYSSVNKPIINISNNFEQQEQYDLITYNNSNDSISIYDDNTIYVTKTPITSFDLTNEVHLKILEILSELKYISCFPLSKSKKIYKSCNSYNLEKNILSEKNLEKNDIEKKIKCENIKSFIMFCENKEHV